MEQNLKCTTTTILATLSSNKDLSTVGKQQNLPNEKNNVIEVRVNTINQTLMLYSNNKIIYNVDLSKC